jgi:hypothetical protein
MGKTKSKIIPNEYTLSFSNKGSRDDVRLRVINEFIKEKPGKGSGGLQSKYIYYVETLNSGQRIYLERPANLHNGFDFVINVENEIFVTKKGLAKSYPSHQHILDDLKLKKIESPQKYKELYQLINNIYNCEEIIESTLKFDSGYPVDLILKVIKWFFIEQDIRYWNYSGRAMFMSGVPKP